MTSVFTRIERTGLVKLAFVSLVVGLAAGKQFQYGTNYRRERDLQSRFYWQLAWRVPALQAGTTILTHELPFSYDDDESLTAGINWIYAPDQNSRNMPYLLYFLKLRLGSRLPGLERGLRIEEKTRATYFLGSTSKVLVMAFDYPKCLRILDPVLDDGLTGLPFLVAEAVPLSDLDLVLTSSDRAVKPPTELFGPEPPRGWCYYFESADLARQRGDWAKVAELGDMALALEARPNDASERIPFIEGYAHVGRWREATTLSLKIVEEQPPMVRLVCRTWNRIEHSTPADTEQQLAIQVLRAELNCTEIEQS